MPLCRPSPPRAVALLLASTLVLAGCSSDKPTGVAAACDLASADTPVNLDPLQGTRISFESGEPCARLNGEGARFLVVPQFATQFRNPDETAFFLGNSEASAAMRQSRAAGPTALERPLPMQQRFDGWLRAREHELAPAAARMAQEARAARPGGAAAASLRAEMSQMAATRTFKTLGNVDGTSFRTVTATLKYSGANIVIYVDNEAPTGFTDEALQRLGPLFDQTLYPIDTAAFGRPSDIDGNGRVIVLMTPRVNALVTTSECREEGFITGYFFGFDLASTDSSRSNRGEVFYTLVPDPAGQFSCAHSVAEVERIVPATFIHELQHMISFNQHVLLRGGRDEDVWLNEGLSLIAEELASRYYEDRYPPPTGRTNPDQLFPDSSQGFIGNNFVYAYDYLENSEEVSVTTFENSGTLKERGGAFLFVRWLLDQKGQGFAKQLVQTNLTGINNVANKAGEPFEALFGDFAVAVYTDSLPGVARTAIPPRYRFTTRNLRQIFARLHAIGAVGPTPYPIVPRTLAPRGGSTGTMVPGTMSHYQLELPAGTTAVPLHLVRSDQRSLDPDLSPQVSVFRLP